MLSFIQFILEDAKDDMIKAFMAKGGQVKKVAAGETALNATRKDWWKASQSGEKIQPKDKNEKTEKDAERYKQGLTSTFRPKGRR